MPECQSKKSTIRWYSSTLRVVAALMALDEKTYFSASVFFIIPHRHVAFELHAFYRRTNRTVDWNPKFRFSDCLVGGRDIPLEFLDATIGTLTRTGIALMFSLLLRASRRVGRHFSTSKPAATAREEKPQSYWKQLYCTVLRDHTSTLLWNCKTCGWFAWDTQQKSVSRQWYVRTGTSFNPVAACTEIDQRIQWRIVKLFR